MFDDGSPYMFLEACAVTNSMNLEHLIGTAMEAEVNELLFGGGKTVLSHGGTERARPGRKGHPKGAVEIEKDSTRGIEVWWCN
jgi:hypothetical protein